MSASFAGRPVSASQPPNSDVQISQDFSTMISTREGEPGRAWIGRLPSIVDDLLGRWELTPDGPAMYGMCAMVLRVTTADGRRGALKVSWVDDETRAEPLALRAWGGRGAVTVLRADDEAGAMLLERLDERRTLLGVPIDRALDVAATVLGDLRVPAVPGLAGAGDTAARWAAEFPEEWERLGRPCEEGLLATAVRLCEVLAVPLAASSTLHGDFHYANILGRGAGDWAAIDPKPLAGDRAYEVVPLLRNRWAEIRGGDPSSATVQRRMRRFAERAELDLTTTYRWCLVRSLDDAMWFQENGYADHAETSWDIAHTMAACL